MAKLKTTPNKAKRKPADPDARIIAAAVKYAQCMAAITAGYGVDPDGNFKFAKRAGFECEARSNLAFLGNHPATTPQGLYAKAHIIPAIVNDDTGWLEMGGMTLLASFAADVKDFTELLVVASWQGAGGSGKAVQS